MRTPHKKSHTALRAATPYSPWPWCIYSTLSSTATSPPAAASRAGVLMVATLLLIYLGHGYAIT